MCDTLWLNCFIRLQESLAGERPAWRGQNDEDKYRKWSKSVGSCFASTHKRVSFIRPPAAKCEKIIEHKLGCCESIGSYDWCLRPPPLLTDGHYDLGGRRISKDLPQISALEIRSSDIWGGGTHSRTTAPAHPEEPDQVVSVSGQDASWMSP